MQSQIDWLFSPYLLLELDRSVHHPLTGEGVHGGVHASSIISNLIMQHGQTRNCPSFCKLVALAKTHGSIPSLSPLLHPCLGMRVHVPQAGTRSNAHELIAGNEASSQGISSTFPLLFVSTTKCLRCKTEAILRDGCKAKLATS
ncbi:hypothetical protein AMTR_s00022p00166250 [Amborella trichopoda]|uniref:Uncharacterized protein n=1 Tax=Amborella trichopoda TaxID=13333 RepID=W1PW80_AMBTC|nr:hypothetical protein AMTR_s00022p00166250 [Amborella trichopoda]